MLSTICLRKVASALIFAASLAAIGCGGNSAPAPQPVVDVHAAAVTKKTIQQIVSADAELYARGIATIVPKISAPIAKFYVNRGSHVRTGELLARLENKDLAAAVEQAKGAYEQAQANYATSTQENLPQLVQQAQLDVNATKQASDSAQAVYESRLKLYHSGAIARNLMNESHVAYIQARNQYEVALAHLKGLEAVGHEQALKLAEGQLAAAKGQYEAALADLQYSEIRSPINGVVTDRPLYEGQMATAGTPMMTIMDLAHVIAHAYIAPQQAALLHVGDAATMSPSASQDAHAVPAKVTVVSPALDPNSTTVQVWVEAPNPGDKLKPGSTVHVSMIAKTVKDALVIPAAAVLTADDGKTSVMVIGSDHHAHQTNITTGIREGNEVQILSGLQAGQMVVTTGAYGLPDHTEVKVVANSTEGGASD
ncbi:MAG TPA: efflux RND transporter periplasmic adaptor subunit [Candidatus Acidoferrales bacterium]|nr:efflux RND transporter periplasmic adaptor subunit [Candidatus Acidoferrales bacterium]